MPLTMANAGEPNIIKKVGGKEEDKKVFGKPRICDRWYRDCCIRDRREHDRECEGFQSCHWKRYGK